MPTNTYAARTLISAAVFSAVLAGPELAAQPGGDRAKPIQPGETCPPGTTEIRPRSCLGPDVPAPSILDYRPRSTLVVPAHVVQKAKYPVIDFHGQPRDRLGSPEDLARLGTSLDGIIVRLMVAANNISGDDLKRVVAAVRGSPRMNDRIRVLTGINFREVGPGWAERAIAQLEADAAAGAVGVGEIGKGFGQNTR